MLVRCEHGRTRCENDILLAAILIEKLCFHKNILRLLCRGSLHSRNPVHFGNNQAVFVVVGFIDNKAVKAELFKGQRGVLCLAAALDELL